MQSNRREFLRKSSVLAACAGGFRALAGGRASLFAAEATEKDFPQPCAADSWKKHGVVVPADQPWEKNHIDNSNASVELLDDGRWRLWYCVNVPGQPAEIAVADGLPGEKIIKTRVVTSAGEPNDAPLAIGNLPKNWKVVQPVHIRLKDGRHRLYFWAHGPKVQRFLAADSNDGRRYRVVDPMRACLFSVWDSGRKDLYAGSKLEDVSTNDCSTVYQLPDGTFELYAQSLSKIDESDPRYVAHDNLKGWVRSIDRFTSEDGLNFNQRQRQVLAADKGDPVDTQFYYLNVTHTPRGRVGLLGWYRVREGYLELQYTFSKDGITWNRTRTPWVPRGKPGEADSEAVYPPQSIVHHDNRWWLFYTGVNYTHSTLKTTQPDDKPGSAIMLATTASLWQA